MTCKCDLRGYKEIASVVEATIHERVPGFVVTQDQVFEWASRDRDALPVTRVTVPGARRPIVVAVKSEVEEWARRARVVLAARIT